ncbi:MAG: restriction endonuclease subunit S [Veillonella sp.]|uniref:restriction endonuclease subunit S n=1 Tax=Veillonella sp. TaxID=1926307 RepID=UPI00257E3363|nr:restriction endonuclease subunit S [Veillonella sp.]MBS6484066.1 restriction endonuclease subunit S [Veillonella sp.]
MEYKRLSDCAFWGKDRTDNINYESYISTENMIKDKGGVTIASSLPDSKTALAYRPNDILLSNIRPYFRKIWYADKNGSCSNDVLVVRANEDIDSKFLYYVLSDNNFFNYDTVTSKGTKMPRGTQTAIMKYLVPDINIGKQRKIANILSAYDNLIENNNKRIRLLEQMAENLYKEWFVRFRFPGYEDTEFEDGMPRDWVREKIGLHYNTCSGGTPSRTHEEYYTEGTIPWVKTGEIKDGIIIHTDECITEAGIKGSSAKLLPQGAVVMAMYGVNIGMLAYLDSEMTCNQACCVFNDKNEINSRHYLFHYLYSIRDYLLLIGFGTAQQNLSQDLIKKVKIVIPPAELIKEFDKQKEPLYQTIRALMMQNDKLIKQRDALLPRLMSGKLEV